MMAYEGAEKVTCKFKTTLPRTPKILKTHTHTHREKKNNCQGNPKPLQRTDTHTQRLKYIKYQRGVKQTQSKKKGE